MLGEELREDRDELSTAQVKALVERFMMSDEADFGPYTWVDPEEEPEIETLVRGRAYRIQLLDRRERDAEVQVFLGIEDLGGLLWEQDLRALMRLSTSVQPSLPTILDGGYLEADRTDEVARVGGMAFVSTLSDHNSRMYADRDVLWFRERPESAFQQFRQLVRALADLHFAGVTHRNISPAGLTVAPGEPRRVRFARFEFSALLTDLFRATVDSARSTDELRDLLVPGMQWYYVPPERVAFLLGGDADLVEDDGSDVFSLAAVVAEWFLGPLGQRPDLVPATQAERDGAVAAERQRAYARRLQTALRESSSVPADLAEILARMLDPDSSVRPAADLVVGLVSEAYERILNAFAGPEIGRPHVLVFMPAESTETIFRWKFINRRPDSEEGEKELAAFITEDVRGAYMIDSPLGAAPFVSGHNVIGLSSARVLVKGQEVAWFCDYYQPLDEDGGLMPATEKGLIIKFVARLDVTAVSRGLEQLDWSTARRLPDVDLVARTVSPQLMERKLARGASWAPRVEATRTRRFVDDTELEFRDALTWLIEYQETELDAHIYPFLRVDDYDGVLVAVRHDQPTDQRRIRNSAMFVKFASSPALRPEMGQFFSRSDDEDGENEVDVLSDRSGRPGPWVTTATVDSVEGMDRIVLRRKRDQPPLPAQGWLRPAADRGAKVGIERQRVAASSLYINTYLQSQLRAPFAIRTLAHRWAGVGDELEGNAPEVVRDMLMCEPFVAVQGPPGTGKTRVAATAVAAYLRQYPAARVLVSAQSNFALDNLAARVLREIGEMDDRGAPMAGSLADQTETARRPLVLRATTSGPDAGSRVDSAIQPWRRLNAATRLARRMSGTVGRRLPAAQGTLREVMERWLEMLADSRDGRSSSESRPEDESVVPELADRLARGANLVFATCAASTPENLCGSSDALFDWVVVEEAAKAWPTEIAMPLLLGRRWTLIGDHFQLPAHRRRDLERFLADCVADPNEAMATVTAERAASFLRHFDLFGELFAARSEQPAKNKPPLHTLSVQFRSREPLGELVSRTFYPAAGPVVPGALPEGRVSSFFRGERRDKIPPIELVRPPELSGRSLIWLDTGDTPACGDQPHWSNPGEASVVIRLLEQLTPFPVAGQNGYGPDPLAILTPYREQLKYLRSSSVASPYLSTVHAFQGREADMVIVSLVRDKAHGCGPGRISAGLGHLAQAQLANVLFSRARRMLVVVGRFDHYQNIMGDNGFWTRLCRAVPLYGEVLSARGVLGEVQNRFDDGETFSGPSLPETAS